MTFTYILLLIVITIVITFVSDQIIMHKLIDRVVKVFASYNLYGNGQNFDVHPLVRSALAVDV